MQPPNIPLRAGPSGPLVNLTTYLNQLSGFIALRRLWCFRLSSQLTIPAGSTPPGVRLCLADVTWAAEEVALAARLKYLCLGEAQLHSISQPDAYPSGVFGHLAIQTPSIAQTPIFTETPTLVPIGGDESYDFVSWFTTYAVFEGIGGTVNNPFEVGTNVLSLNVANAGAGQDLLVYDASFICAELVSDAGQIHNGYQPPYPV